MKVLEEDIIKKITRGKVIYFTLMVIIISPLWILFLFLFFTSVSDVSPEDLQLFVFFKSKYFLMINIFFTLLFLFCMVSLVKYIRVYKSPRDYTILEKKAGYIMMMTCSLKYWKYLFKCMLNKGSSPLVVTLDGVFCVWREVIAELYSEIGFYKYTYISLPKTLFFTNRFIIELKTPNKKEEILELEKEYVNSSLKLIEKDVRFNKDKRLTPYQKIKLRPSNHWEIICFSVNGIVNKRINEFEESLIEINGKEYKVISDLLFLLFPVHITVNAYIFVDYIKNKNVMISFEYM